jgi:hypothetical protein
MTLDEGQRRKVAEWIEQGLKLSEIQSKLSKEFGIGMTYMDLRFLIDDLKLRPKDPAPPTPAPEIAAAKTAAPATGAANAKAPPGKVSLTVDSIAKPGAIVSGRVTFSDGKGGAWLIDQMGRPGLVPDQQGYRPPPEDIAEFQRQLQDELARMGY